MKTKIAAVVMAFHLALVSGAMAQALTFEKVNGPDGGPIQTVAAFGDTVLVAPYYSEGVAGPIVSWDRGKTWAVSQVPKGWAGISQFLKLGDRLFALSDEKGLLLSKNGGKSWEQSPGKPAFVKVAIMGQKLVGFGYPDGFSVSDDLGAHWQKRTTPLDINVDGAPDFNDFTASEDKILVSFVDKPLYESDDAGKNWKIFYDNAARRKTDDLYSGPRQLVVCKTDLYFDDDGTFTRKPLSSGGTLQRDTFDLVGEYHGMDLGADGDRMYVAGNNQVFSSADGGKNWDSLPAPESNDTYGSLSIAPHQFVMIVEEDVYAYDRDQKTWSPLAMPGLGSHHMLGMGRQGGVLFFHTDKGIFTSSDKGKTWENTNPFDQYYSQGSLQATDGRIFYNADQYDSETKKWSDIGAELPLQLTAFEGYGDRWVATNSYGSAFKVSRDHRKTWAEIKPWGAQQRVVHQYATDGELFVMQSNLEEAVVSADFGQTWKPTTLPGDHPMVLRFWTAEHRILMVARSGISSEVIGPYASDDSGTTWNKIDFGAASPAAVLLYLEGNIGYAQDDKNVLVSHDAGRTWSVAGAPPADVALNVTGPLLYGPRAEGGFWVAELEAPAAARVSHPGIAGRTRMQGPRAGLIEYRGRVYSVGGRNLRVSSGTPKSR